MLSERPSAKKVAGVSRRYLACEEADKRLEVLKLRYNNEDLSPEDVVLVTNDIGITWCTGFVSRRFQDARTEFLQHAQEVEGKAPGQENIAAFALAHVGAPSRYRLVARSLDGDKA